MDFALCLLIGVLPVIVLLIVLISLDSYKLVHPREVLRAIAMGSLVAGASYLIHLGVMEWTGLEARTLACLDPVSGALWEFRSTGFVPRTPEHPLAAVTGESAAWYQGKRGFLPPAAIVPRPMA